MIPFDYLLEANRVLSSTLELPDLLRKVMAYATAVVNAETSSLLLYDEASRDLSFALALSDKESSLKGIRLPLGTGIAGAAALDRTTQIVNDVTQDQRWSPGADERTAFTTRSILAVPLLFQGRLLGVVEAINKKGGPFSTEDARLLEAFAAQAAVAIDNARSFARLAEEKDKLSALFARMSDGALLAGADGLIALVNEAAGRLLGTVPRAGMPLAAAFAGFSAEPPLSSVAGAGGTIELRRLSGKRLLLQGTVSPVTGDGGRPAGTVMVIRDVTAERNESFMKASFLSLISHKLRTPLVAITGYCPLLLDDPSLSERARKAIASIQRQGTLLANLVDKLLQVTMIDHETLSLEQERCSFSDLVAAAVGEMEDYLIAQRAGVFIHPSVRDLPALAMDRAKMALVVKSIVENAVKFNPAADKSVSVTGIRDGGCVGIAIVDNGPGIPTEERENVFQKFYQIEEAFTGQVEGAGIGLAISRRVIEKHGGRISLSGAPGAGTTVTILMPSSLGACA